MAGDVQARPYGHARLALVAGLLALLAMLLAPGGPVAPAPAAAQAPGCPPYPTGLNPLGDVPTRFTMLLRINTQGNVDDYVNKIEATGGLGGRVRPQDVFVINTRFTGSGAYPPVTPAVATQLATNLQTAFPCNRIIALNGLSFDPAAAGYAFSLIDHSQVWALMSDFEPMDWNAGKATDPSRASWNQKYKTALSRIKAWMGLLSNNLAANPIGAGKRAGLVPIDISTWNFGEIAQAIDKKNRRLGSRHLGPLSIQTQDSCANGGPSGLAQRYKTLLDQYRYKFVKRRVFRKGKKRKITVRRKIKKKARPLRSNLGLQISFSDTPNPNAGMALTKTGPSQADACVASGLQAGGGAFFFFASTEAMRLLFGQPTVFSLRPPTTSGK